MTEASEASDTPRSHASVTFPARLGSRVRAALLPTSVVVAAAVLGVFDPGQWVAWLLLLTQLPMAALRWLVVRDAWRRPWALRVDAAGVWWRPQGPPLPWASVVSIEVHDARGFRRLLPHWHQVVLVDPAQADFARRARTRPFGRSIPLDEVRATPEALVASFRAYTDAPAGLRLR